MPLAMPSSMFMLSASAASAPTFSSLCRSEPRLGLLRGEAFPFRDDGSREVFARAFRSFSTEGYESPVPGLKGGDFERPTGTAAK